MAVGSLSPVAIQQFFDANGDPLAGGKLFLYLAGTTTPTPAYADVGLTTPLANPVILDAAGRAPELFLGALTYKQVLQNAGGVTIWTADNIVTPTALRSAQSNVSLTGNQSNVPVPTGIISFLVFQNASPLYVDGFAGGTPGQLLIVRAGDLAPVYLVNWNHSASAGGNTIVNFVTSGPTPLAGPQGIAVYVYASIPSAGGQYHWMLVTHEQGQAIRVPFNAANYYPSGGAGTPVTTVDAVDILSHDYVLDGAQLTVSVQLRGITVTGGPLYLIVDGFPYTCRVDCPLPSLLQYGFGTFEPVVMSSRANMTWIAFNRAGNTPWEDGTDNVNVFGQLSFDVI